MQIKLSQLLLALIVIGFQSCSKINNLENSLELHRETTKNNLIKFNFKEQLNTLGHKSEPWETDTYSGKGNVWVNKNTFQKQDSLTNSRGRVYKSKTDYTNNMLLYLDYGDTELLPITKDFEHTI